MKTFLALVGVCLLSASCGAGPEPAFSTAEAEAAAKASTSARASEAATPTTAVTPPPAQQPPMATAEESARETARLAAIAGLEQGFLRVR